MTQTGSPSLRCTDQTAALGENPAGTAGSALCYLLVELPLPWPPKIEQHPILDGVDWAASGASDVRVLAIIGTGTDTADGHRVISYRRAPGAPFDGFDRSETTVGTESVAETINRVMAGAEVTDHETAAAATDILVCTHGTRDRCCGAVGTLVHLELETLVAERSDVTVWRTSHLGGHRFAPTALVFPTGLGLAHADAETIVDIVDQRREPADLQAHLRGCVGIDGVAEQLADLAALATVGWSWLDQPRHAAAPAAPDVAVPAIAALDVAAGAGRIDHLVQVTGGSRRSFTVRLTGDGSVPVPLCGAPLNEAEKQADKLRVVAVDAV